MGEENTMQPVDFKAFLAERKRRLWAEVRDDIFRSVAEGVHDEWDIPQDPGDRSLLDLLADQNLVVAGIRKEELTQLEEAQQRLEMGRYGICEECGEEIGIARLKVVPFTAHCIKCQKAKEGPPRFPTTKL